MSYFEAPEEVLNFIADLLDTKRGELGLKYVAYGDEDKIPRYPAVKVAAGPLSRDFHATHTFQNTFSVELLVYHGNLNATHAQRSKNDLELASAIRELLHSNMTLSGGVIQGWIVSEGPATIARRQGPSIVGTRMVWQGIAQQSFS